LVVSTPVSGSSLSVDSPSFGLMEWSGALGSGLVSYLSGLTTG